mmetsp:Transcript_26937/g.36067  ORF Transcript_26937/g.36067 Transcript_26937/m.36067 type:complete len:161 (+) Transcript_26937:85-567(+)
MKCSLLLALLVAVVGPTFTAAFTSTKGFSAALVPKTRLNAGPLFKGKDYERVVENIMVTKNLSREDAEKDYNAYLENPNNYALSKGEAYYRGLGYSSLMEGVIGEAEKEGKGDEVRERMAEFKKQSQIKGLSVISVFLVLFFYFKIQYDNDPTSLTYIAH